MLYDQSFGTPDARYPFLNAAILLKIPWELSVVHRTHWSKAPAGEQAKVGRRAGSHPCGPKPSIRG